jgi:hypothetical protein
MERPRRRLEYNIKLDLKEIGWKNATGLVWLNDQWRTVVNTVMNLRVP